MNTDKIRENTIKECIEVLGKRKIKIGIVKAGSIEGIKTDTLENAIKDLEELIKPIIVKPYDDSLTTRESNMLELLKSFRGRFTSPTQLGSLYGYRFLGKEGYHSSLASPICLSLVKKGLAVRNDKGWYRSLVMILLFMSMTVFAQMPDPIKTKDYLLQNAPEREFDISIPDGDVEFLTTVKELIDYVVKVCN